MMTECNRQQLEFRGLGRRRVTAKFDGGHLTSDGGGVLLREVDARLGLFERLTQCFADHRNPAAIEHSVKDLISQRIYALALGYEDLNDHTALRADPLLALLVGKRDITGADRRRRRDRGSALASASVLNRLELSCPAKAPSDRYKKIAANFGKMDALLADLFLESRRRPPSQIVLRPGRHLTIRYTATRRAGSFTATTAPTAIYPCTSSAAITFCWRGSSGPTAIPGQGWQRS